MRSSQQLILSAILTYLVLLTPLAGTARSDEIRWHTNFDAALKEARERNRPVLFDVYKVPCAPCMYLDNFVYRDPAVVKFINDHYVALKLDGEKQTIRIREDEVVARFPTLLFLTPDRRILETSVGALEPAPFLDLTQKVLTAYAALSVQVQGRPQGRPFQGGVRMGPNNAWLGVWGGLQIVPPSDGSFSFQPLTPHEERTLRARALLHQAEDSFRRQQWLTCMDLSRSLVLFYPDLPESTSARQLEQSIGADRLERLGRDLSENLGQVYWELAQEKIRQNQLAEAVSYMEKIVQFCPGTRHVAAAQEYLRSLNRASTEQEPASLKP